MPNIQVLEREPIVPDFAQRELAEEGAFVLAEYIEEYPSGPTTITLGETGNARRFVASLEVLQAIEQLLQYLAQGQTTTIFSLAQEVGTQEAANYLNVSRPYVVSLLDKGALPFRKVGVRHRILLEDLIRFKKIDDAQRSESARQLTLEAVRLGLYDQE